jgi:hypothetical protein
LFVADPGAKKLEEYYPRELFWAYNVWTSARNFFNILGIMSNIFFFGATILGALVGNILSRNMLLSVDEVQEERADVSARFSDIKPLMGSLHRR